MTTTFEQQIKAIQKARALLSHTDRKELDACLNDAGSTIAALNLTKDVQEVNLIDSLKESNLMHELQVFIKEVSELHADGNPSKLIEKAKELIKTK
jgi:hypothetical protein